MSYVVAGVFSGLLMASVFGAIGPVVLFRLFTGPTPFLEGVRARVPPMAMMMGVVILSYPVWTVIGVLLALLYALSTAGGTDAGAIAYRVAVVAVALAVVVPIAVLLKRMLVGLTALTLVFVADFGWLLPLLAG